jgi:hypothetical protein
MSRTAIMRDMVADLRAEAGHSLAVSQGTNVVDTLEYYLRRTQEELWVAFAWPELILRADVSLAPGQYLYPFPATMDFEQIRESWFAVSGAVRWNPIDYGIEEDAIMPGSGANSTSGTPCAWDLENGTTFRVWPTPTGASTIRFKGNKKLNPFIAETDNCTLDATVIILFAAAELLARAKAEDAPSKQQKAQRHLTKLLGAKISQKRKVSTLGGGSRNWSRALTPGIDYIPT